VAALGGSAYDFLRFVPMGCARIAMIQSDDINVYNQTVRYASWIDVVVGVSKEICRKAQMVLKTLQIGISYQPYGVPMPISPSTPARTKNLRVLYLGRLFEEQKRVNLMARIIRSTLNSPFPFQWTIAGDGDELPKLRERFADCPARVSFLGGIPYDQVPALFAQNDVYFLCSNYEGLPLSLIEAMGAGLVPVVSDLPSGIPEVVNSQNGIRVPVESESGYIDALLRLAVNRGLLEEMAVESIAAVRYKFSIETMTNRWLSMLSIGQSEAIDWKRNFYATAPLQLQNKLVYQPIFRPLRRLFKRIPKRIWNTVAQL
jgi:glycosyltransferase involved in cell wall biosynthesis